MPSVKDAWADAARVTLTLPSGFRVRGVLPAPSEVVRLKIVPQKLRQAVVAFSGGGRLMSDLNEDEHAQLVEARRYQAAAFVKEMAAPGTTGDDGWEAITVTKDELAKMPPADVEALDDLIGGYATADMITANSEVALGLRTRDDADAVAEGEAGDTVDGWSAFRDDGRSDDVGAPSASVVDPAVDDPRDTKPVDGVRRRRRARTSAAAKGSTGDGQVASA